MNRAIIEIKSNQTIYQFRSILNETIHSIIKKNPKINPTIYPTFQAILNGSIQAIIKTNAGINPTIYPTSQHLNQY